MGGRPTVGHMALNHGIGVRIPASQPDFAHASRELRLGKHCGRRQARSLAFSKRVPDTRSLSRRSGGAAKADNLSAISEPRHVSRNADGLVLDVRLSSESRRFRAGAIRACGSQCARHGQAIRVRASERRRPGSPLVDRPCEGEPFRYDMPLFVHLRELPERLRARLARGIHPAPVAGAGANGVLQIVKRHVGGSVRSQARRPVRKAVSVRETPTPTSRRPTGAAASRGAPGPRVE